MGLNFGEKVRALREDSDITQSELGRKLQMTQRKVSYLECGKSEPSMEDICELCRFFRVSADFLLGLPKGLTYPER